MGSIGSVDDHHVSPSTVVVFRAADWKLDEPQWTGRMKIISKGKVAFIKLEDKNSGKRRLVAVALCYRIDH